MQSYPLCVLPARDRPHRVGGDLPLLLRESGDRRRRRHRLSTANLFFAIIPITPFFVLPVSPSGAVDHHSARVA